MRLEAQGLARRRKRRYVLSDALKKKQLKAARAR
jgi:hypothetical protein